MNINVYLKHLVLQKQLKLKEISYKTSLDPAYISRVLNNKTNITKDKNYLKFCYALNINKEDLFKYDSSFNSLCNEYLNAAFYLDREKRIQLFEDITEYSVKINKTPQYLEYLLIEFVNSVITKENDTYLADHLIKLYKGFSNYHKKVFLTFYYGYHMVKEEYGAEPYFEEALSIETESQNLEMMLYFYKFGSFAQNPSSFDLNYYTKCKEILELRNNHKRLINLNILYSIFLRNFGYIKEGLDNDLSTLKLVNDLHLTYSIEILLNNISNSYLLLNDFDNALNYYLETLKYLKTNSTYFSIAFCLYRTNRKKECKEYLELGKTATNRSDYYHLLILWLDSMTKKEYSKKCYDILIQLYSKNFEKLVPQQKNFILLELINYYKFHHMYKEALDLSTDLINKNIVSQTQVISFKK